MALKFCSRAQSVHLFRNPSMKILPTPLTNLALWYLPFTSRCLSIKSKVCMPPLLQKYLNDIQHHGKLAEQQYTIILQK